MKRLVLLTAISAMFALTACDQNKVAPQAAPEQAAIVPEPVKVDHYYSMKDGVEYGYEQGLSQDAQNAGQAATKLMMFKFSGQKNGVYQVFSAEKSGATVTLQCENPCNYIKSMSFYQLEHTGTERMKATEGTVGWAVMADAINGKLEKFQAEKNGKKFEVWFDEKKGMTATQIKP